jgi:microcompartment protein CcmK/EutM
MIIAKVVGSAVATLKHELLKTTKLLLVSPADVHGKVTGQPFLATGQNSSPADAAIVGILDSLEYQGAIEFRKE